MKILLSHSTENLRRGNLCFRKLLVSKNVKDKRERGHHDSPSKICCLNTEKLRRGNLCFRNFWYRKILWMRSAAREYHNFQLEILCLTEPKNFVEEPFCVAEAFWYPKMSRREREGGHHDFPSKICCLTVLRNFVWETCVSESFWYRKILRIREGGGITTFCRKFVVSQYRKTSQGKLVFQKSSGIAKFYG